MAHEKLRQNPNNYHEGHYTSTGRPFSWETQTGVEIFEDFVQADGKLAREATIGGMEEITVHRA